LDYRLRKVAAAGLLSALAIALNFPLLGFPNIEVFSLCMFIAGVFLGLWGGLVVPLIAGSIFVTFNPNGPPSLILVAIAQLIGFMLFGIVGALFGKSILKNKNRLVGMTFCAAIGVVFTFLYDILTNMAFALSTGPFWPTFVGGNILSLVHIVSNGILFGLSEPLMVKLWRIASPRLYQLS
jgi:hypothetical protein